MAVVLAVIVAMSGALAPATAAGEAFGTRVQVACAQPGTGTILAESMQCRSLTSAT